MSLTILGRNQRLVHLLPEAKELRVTGFQSPAEDEKEEGLSLDALTNLGAPHVWVVRVEDDSLIGFGMYPGDRLVVDRGNMSKREQYVVVDLEDDGCYRVRLMIDDGHDRLVLRAPNRFTPDVNLEYEECVQVWGVVRWVISYVGR
ncbi:S24 family peptidase [Pseudomonas sp. D2-3]